MDTREGIQKKWEECQQKIEDDPYNIWNYQEGFGLLELLDRGQEAYDMITEQLPNFEGYNKSLIYNCLGNMYYGKKEYSLALEQYKLAIEIEPDPYFVSNLGHIHVELGQYEKADKYYQEILETNPNFSNALCGRGRVLAGQGKPKEAIDLYTKAIQNYPSDPILYCRRGAVYQEVGDQSKALGDLKTAKELIAKGQVGPNSAVYIKLVLDRIKSIVQLEEDLEKAQKTIDDVSKTEVNNVEVQKAIKKFQNLKELKNKVSNKLIQNITQQETKQEANKQQEEKQHILDLLKKDPGSFTEIIAKFPQALAFPEIATFLAMQLSQVCQQVKDISSHQKEQDKILEKHETALQDGGVYEKALIKKEFQAFKDQDPQLYEYCNTFYWTCINLFGAYRSLSTGLVGKELPQSAQDDLLAAGASKVAGYAVELASGIPFVGGVIGMIDKVIEDVVHTAIKAKKNNEFDNKVNTITKVIQAKFGLEEDISINVAKVAIALTKAREQNILYPETVNHDQQVGEALDWLSQKLESVTNTFLPKVEVNDTNNKAVALALSDLTLFMAYLHKNYETVIKRKDPIDVQITSILKFDGLTSLIKGQVRGEGEEEEIEERDHLLSKNEKNLSQPAQGACCTTCSIF